MVSLSFVTLKTWCAPAAASHLQKEAAPSSPATNQLKKSLGVLNHVSEPTPCPKDGQTCGTFPKADFEFEENAKTNAPKNRGQLRPRRLC